MAQLTIQHLDNKTKQKAQYMYFANRDVTEIATALKIDPDTVRFYIFGVDGEGTDKNCWFQIKKGLKPTAIAIYLADKGHVLEQTAGLATEIVNFSLAQLRDAVVNGEHEPLNLDDLVKLSKIATDMDKMMRLESGQATDIIKEMGLSRAEAKEILANDPFAQDVVVEAEFSDLPWLKDEEVVGGE
jgi:hypothetical protein